MKISVASDIHLEHDPSFRLINPGSDVLILSGDILVIDHLNRSVDSPYQKYKEQYAEFFMQCSNEWDHVFVVTGNHEYYHGYIDKYDALYKEWLSAFHNVTLLQNSYKDYEGFRFVGGTLWTDMNGYNPVTEMMVEQYMNDFRIIKWSTNYRRFRATDAESLHERTKHVLSNHILDSELPMIVCTHHAPSEQSIHKRYAGEVSNYGYFSRMEPWIEERPKIALWTHGHVHTPFDYNIGSTRVVCNPKGYPNEVGVYFDFNKIIEV